MHHIHVKFYIKKTEKWVNIDNLLEDKLALEDYFLELRMRDFRWIPAGFLIEIDKKMWGKESLLDEMQHAETWFDGLISLVTDNRTVGVWDWEQSHLLLQRVGSVVEMWDTHPPDETIRPRVSVNLSKLVSGFVSEGRKFAQLVDIINSKMTKEEIERELLPINLMDKIGLLEVFLEEEHL